MTKTLEPVWNTCEMKTWVSSDMVIGKRHDVIIVGEQYYNGDHYTLIKRSASGHVWKIRTMDFCWGN